MDIIKSEMVSRSDEKFKLIVEKPKMSGSGSNSNNYQAFNNNSESPDNLSSYAHQNNSGIKSK